MTTFWRLLEVLLILAIASPIIIDIAVPEAHFCKSLLNKLKLYRKLTKYIDDHKRMFIRILLFGCPLIIYPLLFRCGYNSFEEKDLSIFVHPLYSDVEYELKGQILNNDSLFVVHIGDTNPYVYNRISQELEKKALILKRPEDYLKKVNRCMPSKMLYGLFAIPSWKEVKSNAKFSSDGKKVWIICCMAMGYFGYNQGHKYHNKEFNNKIKDWGWNKFDDLQAQLNDENWWRNFSERYPYQENGLVLDESLFDPEAIIGVSIDTLHDQIVIKSVYKDFPAEKAGIKKGDRIILIDGSLYSVRGASPEQIVGLLSGPSGSYVNLHILRPDSSKTINFNVKRVASPVDFSQHKSILLPE